MAAVAASCGAIAGGSHAIGDRVGAVDATTSVALAFVEKERTLTCG